MYHECFVWQRIRVAGQSDVVEAESRSDLLLPVNIMTATNFLLIIYDYSHLFLLLDAFGHLYISFDIFFHIYIYIFF